MRYESQKKTKVIFTQDPLSFEKEMNAFLSRREIINPQVLYNTNMQGFCAYITYSESKCVPETVKEEYEVVGQRFKCKDCKLYKPSADGRIKYVKCPHSNVRMSKECGCCDWFYEQIDSGNEQEVLKEI